MSESVGVREAKNRFSELTTEVNASGVPLTVLRNNRPWVVIYPADEAAASRRERLERFRRTRQPSRRGTPPSPTGTFSTRSG